MHHSIKFTEENSLIEILKPLTRINAVNAIHCDLPTLVSFQHDLVLNFPSTKFLYCKNMTTDVTNRNNQIVIIAAQHNRAHRAAKENVKQDFHNYYFIFNGQAS